MENEYQENAVVEPVAAETEEFVLTQDAIPMEAAMPERRRAKAKKLLGIPTKIWVLVGAVVIVAAIGLVAWNLLSNTYETPIKLMMDLKNAKKHSDVLDEYIDLMNGFSEDELRDIFDVLKKSDYVGDMLENLQEQMEDAVEDFEDEYGSNYKFSYKIEDKEKLEKEDLREVRDEFKDAAAGLKKTLLDETEDFDSDDWEAFADQLGITKSQAKNLVKAYEALYKEWKSVEVTEGYELTVTLITEGSELDEPEEEEETIMVYKINGRWVNIEAISPILRMMGVY